MHIPDGILSGPVIGATCLLGAAGVLVGLRRLDFSKIPRAGILASAFFVASLIHVPIGVSSTHLLLCGLMGFFLGWAAFPALAVALLLQAILFGFGGLTSLGANVLAMGVPAVVCYYLFGVRLGPAMAGRTVFWLGFVGGALSVVLATVVAGITLYATGREFLAAAGAILVGHIPVVVIEGFVTGSAVAFVHKVRPELLACPLPTSPPKEHPDA